MENFRDFENEEQKEKEAIELENKILAFLLPAVGGIAFIIGLVGFILTITEKVGPALFLLFLALLGAGGIAYGAVVWLKAYKNRFRKKEVEPSPEPTKHTN